MVCSNWLILTLGFLVAANGLLAEPPAPSSVQSALALQNALYQARQALAKGDARQAVKLLEANLHQINGNKDYLAALRDAYFAHLKELQQADREIELRDVLQRLRVLDPTAELPGYPAPTPSKARAQEEESAAPGDNARKPAAREWAARGKAAFRQKQYREAANFFAKAHAIDPESLADEKANWAYCRLHQVTERLNEAANDDPDANSALEHEVQSALVLASGRQQLFDFGQKVLAQVRQRGSAAARSSNWSIVESQSFRLRHRHDKEFADRVLAAAERARAQQFDKWYGSEPPPWSPRCDIFLYPSTAEYSLATKPPAPSPGHSTMELRDGKIIARQLHLAGDQLQLISGTIPHEVTHLVLGDLFPHPLLPRWADEAMAVLAEPRNHVERYLRTLSRCRQDNSFIPLSELLPMNDFPDGKRITAFYCESVALVDWLIQQKDPQTFAMFLRDAQRYGYEKALERSYGIRGYAELQKKLLARFK